MKKTLSIIFLFAAGLAVKPAHAGNDNKRGQGGATELLVNPFARNTGWAGANTSGVHGVEAMWQNIAGLAYVRKTEVSLAHTRYLSGTNIGINNLAFGQRVSSQGVMGLSVTAFNLGDFLETTYLLPDGTGNTFSPSVFNIAASYAHTFSSRVTGGILVRLVNQGIPNVDATGVCFDAGVQYLSDNKKFQLGVALRNLGPKMQYSGDGLRYRSYPDPNRTDFTFSFSQLAQAFEMPAVLNIGAGYNFFLPGDNRLSLVGNFQSNSFTKDQVQLGAEYSFMEMFYARAGWTTMGSITNGEGRNDVHTGLSAGAGVEIPFAQIKSTEGESLTDEMSPAQRRKATSRLVGIDYSYRATNPFAGTHTIGVTLNF